MSWKRLSILVLSAIPLMGASSCGTPPIITAKQWLGSSEAQGVISSQGEVVQCAEPKFDEFACYTLEDVQKILNTYLACCQQWKPACTQQLME